MDEMYVMRCTDMDGEYSYIIIRSLTDLGDVVKAKAADKSTSRILIDIAPENYLAETYLNAIDA